MDLQLTIVIDQAELSEFVHKLTDTRPGRADHLRERLLANLGQDRLRRTFLAEIREEQKCPCQTLFAGVEQLIDQVSLNSAVAVQEIGREHLAKSWLGVEDADHSAFATRITELSVMV